MRPWTVWWFLWVGALGPLGRFLGAFLASSLLRSFSCLFVFFGLCPSLGLFLLLPFRALPLSASAWASLPLCPLPSFSPLLWPCFWSFLVPCCSVLLALYLVSSLLVCRGLSWVSFGPFQFPSSPFGLRLPVLCVRARVLPRVSWVSVPLSFPLCEGGSALRSLCKNRDKNKNVPRPASAAPARQHQPHFCGVPHLPGS